MNILENIADAVVAGKMKDVKALVNEALESGIAAGDILNDALIAGMMATGEKFKRNEIYVPEMLFSARAMNKGVEILKPHLTSEGVEPVGKAVICTVKGDLHDIGKNLVKMMLEGVGIECIDLGTDVSANQIVDAVKESGAELVCLSSLLTTTIPYHKDVIDAFADAGMRDQVKIMIGGAPVTQEFAESVGADAYTKDAAEAADAALVLLGKK